MFPPKSWAEIWIIMHIHEIWTRQNTVHGKIKKSECRCDMLHSKSEERVRKDIPSKYSDMWFSLTKALTTPIWLMIKKMHQSCGEVRLVFSYRCKAPMSICTQSERSALVAINNGSSMPACIGRNCENMWSLTNKQVTNRHNKNSHPNTLSMWGTGQ